MQIEGAIAIQVSFSNSIYFLSGKWTDTRYLYRYTHMYGEEIAGAIMTPFWAHAKIPEHQQ